MLVRPRESPGPQLNQGDLPDQLQLAESIPLAIPRITALETLEIYLSSPPPEFLSKYTQRLKGNEGPRLLISISEIIARTKDAPDQIIIIMATIICGWLFGLCLARDSYLLERGWSLEDYSHQFRDAVQSEVTIPGDRWHIWGTTFWIQHQWGLPRSYRVEAHLGEENISAEKKHNFRAHERTEFWRTSKLSTGRRANNSEFAMCSLIKFIVKSQQRCLLVSELLSRLPQSNQSSISKTSTRQEQGREFCKGGCRSYVRLLLQASAEEVKESSYIVSLIPYQLGPWQRD